MITVTEMQDIPSHSASVFVENDITSRGCQNSDPTHGVGGGGQRGLKIFLHAKKLLVDRDLRQGIQEPPGFKGLLQTS